MARLRLAPLLALALFGASCTNGTALVVQLVSNLGPQSEVDVAHVHVARGGVTQTDVDVPLSGASSLGRATRLVDLEGIEPTRYEVTITLALRGATVQTRRVVRDVAGRTIVTVLMTRDCNGVMCPAADAAAVECLGGRCVTPGCDEEHPEQCGTPGCHDASECAMSTVSCAPARCSVSGACFAQPDDGLCGGGQICDVVRGCIAAPIGDAGVVADAGMPDAGPPPYTMVSGAVSTDAGNTTTTAAIDTTGSSLLVALVVGYQDSVLGIEDSAANVWVPLTRVGPSTGGNGTGTTVLRFYYVAHPTTSTSHTFTATATNLFASIDVTAWRGGLAMLDAEVATGNANGSATFSPGTIVPMGAGELIFTGWGSNDDYGANLVDVSIDSGFTIFDALINPPGESIALAVRTSTGTAPVHPSWTMTPNATTAVSAMAAFR